jgi:hypothetical protein
VVIRIKSRFGSWIRPVIKYTLYTNKVNSMGPYNTAYTDFISKNPKGQILDQYGPIHTPLVTKRKPMGTKTGSELRPQSTTVDPIFPKAVILEISNFIK